MKRFWLGIVILGILLMLGITVTLAVDCFCRPISKGLEEAAQAVQKGQWEQARQLSDESRERWEQHRALHAAVTNHEPMEQIDALFRMLDIYDAQGDMIRFAECCAQLSSLTAAISEAQDICWWNLL